MEMSNLRIYDAVRQVPKEAQKTITGGRLNGKTDINPMWRIKALTGQFGPAGTGWYYDIKEQRLEASPTGEVAAFVTIDLFVKVGDEWSKPICGVGGSSFVVKEKSGPYMSDECFKMALTDAISVSCKALGMGADIYWGADRTKYDASPQIAAQPQAEIDREIAENDILLAVKLCKTISEIEVVYKQKRSSFRNQSRLIEACAARKRELAA